MEANKELGRSGEMGRKPRKKVEPGEDHAWFVLVLVLEA